MTKLSVCRWILMVCVAIAAQASCSTGGRFEASRSEPDATRPEPDATRSEPDATGTGGLGGSSGGSAQLDSSATGDAVGRSGASGQTGDASAEPPECTDATDCDGTDSECGTRTCSSGRCGFDAVAADTPAQSQTAGDCKLNVCDGSGGLAQRNDDTDVGNDGLECTDDVCENGVRQNPFKAPGSPCGSGTDTQCDGQGRCVGCIDDGDCPSDTPCANWACSGGSCRMTPNTNGPCGTPPSCALGVQVNQDLCDANGVCVDKGTKSCAPFVCSGSACRTTCTASSQCVSGYYCSGQACLPKKNAGSTCAAAGECQSGFCVDGVCCSSACTGLCLSCNAAAATRGQCSPIAANQDPDNECLDARACNGSGACGGVWVCGGKDGPCNGPQGHAFCCDQGECLDQTGSCASTHNTPCGSIGATASFLGGYCWPNDCGGVTGGTVCLRHACSCAQ